MIKAAASIIQGAAFFVIIACLNLPALAESPKPALIVFHTNDTHGYVAEERDSDGRLVKIGYARLKAFIDKETRAPKLLLDAGDLLQGHPAANASKGGTIAGIAALINYDAIAAGNHDFDYGAERLLELNNTFHLNFMAGNISKKEDNSHLLPPYLVKNFDGLRVGIFALSTAETPLKTSPANVAGLTFGSPDDILRLAGLQVDMLRNKEKADLIIALTHLGTEARGLPSSEDLARAVPGIDLIVDGHSHAKLAGLKAGGALIVSAGAYFEDLGKVEVYRKADGGFFFSSELLAAESFAELAPDKQLAALINELVMDFDSRMAAVAGYTPIFLNGERQAIRSGETGLGRIICAAMVWHTGADAAIFNSGSIRASLQAGDISRGNILEVLPYNNQVVIVSGISGTDILKALEHGYSLPGDGGFPQTYGLEVSVQKREKVIKDQSHPVYDVKSVMIGGEPLRADKTYTIAINDFMHDGGDGYDFWSSYTYQTLSPVEDIFLQFLAVSPAEKLIDLDRSRDLKILP